MNLQAYRGNDPFIFASYAHADECLVEPIFSRILADGYRFWFDAGIDPGTEWDENIASHIENCGYLIAFISKNYLASENCKDELNYARDLNKKRLLVYLEDVSLPGGMAMRLNRLQAIFRHKYEEEEKFFEALFQADGIAAFLDAVRPAAKRPTVKAPSRAVSPKTKTVNFTDGSVYTGEVNAGGLPQGKGEKKYKNGDSYEGEWAEGLFHGEGTYRWANGKVYKGEFQKDKIKGHGTAWYANGDSYEGEWEEGLFHGEGTYHWANGKVYKGEFRKDKATGHGTAWYANGDTYEGEWENWIFHGEGTYRWTSGKIYKGEFQKDKATGRGTAWYPNGDTYEGDWVDWHFHGRGLYRFKNGAVYDGEWKDDKINGRGTYRWANGDVFEGTFTNGLNATGKMRYANGRTEAGTLESGVFSKKRF